MNAHNRHVTGVLMFIAGSVLYLITNHVHFSEPQLLPLTWVDSAVPFVPNTLWIYISEYIYFPVIYVLCKDLENLNKYLFSFLSLQIFSAMIFMVWPTTYPRASFPLPPDLNSITAFAFTQLRQADTPASCCPSLHVSSVYLSSFVFLDEQRPKFVFFFVWGTLIALSTLTTKQHYLVDVLSGFAMAILFYWLFHRAVPYRRVAVRALSDS